MPKKSNKALERSTRSQPDTFARRLRELREAAGLSLYALAKLCNVTQQHLGRLERGEREPSFVVARKIATALGKGLECWG